MGSSKAFTAQGIAWGQINARTACSTGSNQDLSGAHHMHRVAFRCLSKEKGPHAPSDRQNMCVWHAGPQVEDAYRAPHKAFQAT